MKRWFQQWSSAHLSLRPLEWSMHKSMWSPPKHKEIWLCVCVCTCVCKNTYDSVLVKRQEESEEQLWTLVLLCIRVKCESLRLLQSVEGFAESECEFVQCDKWAQCCHSLVDSETCSENVINHRHQTYLSHSLFLWRVCLLYLFLLWIWFFIMNFLFCFTLKSMFRWTALIIQMIWNTNFEELCTLATRQFILHNIIYSLTKIFL